MLTKIVVKIVHSCPKKTVECVESENFSQYATNLQTSNQLNSIMIEAEILEVDFIKAPAGKTKLSAWQHTSRCK